MRAIPTRLIPPYQYHPPTFALIDANTEFWVLADFFARPFQGGD
jgi:hypothetical protein